MPQQLSTNIVRYEDGTYVCGCCGSEVPPPAPYQSGANNRWYVRQVCPNSNCREMFVNEGPYNSAQECPGRSFTQGPGR